MTFYQMLYLLLAAVLWISGYLFVGKYVRPKWKIPGKFIFYMAVSFGLVHYFDAYALIFIIIHPSLGLWFHITSCKKQGINWKTCEPRDKFLELHDKWARGDYS